MHALPRKNYDTETAEHAVTGGVLIDFPGPYRGPEPATASTGAPWTPVKFLDATALTPFDPADPVLATQIIVTQGANAKSNDWKPVKADIGTMLNHLIKHEVGPKDGRAWVLADMVPGARTKNGVKAMYAAGLDIDTGMGGAAIDAEMAKLGHLGVRYTTHSHMKGETRVKKDLLIAWAMKHRADLNADAENVELIRAFLQESKRYDPAVAQSAELVRFDHVENGIEAVIEHAPMPKHRVIVFLSEPFEIAKEGRTQKEALDRWRKIPQALARKLGNLPIDSTGSDPNRLFFLPRHAKGAPYEISLFGGPLLNWRELTLADDPPAQRGGSKSSTDAGKALGQRLHKIADGLQIADVIRDHAGERIRHDDGLKLTIECPFDRDHSNSEDTGDTACFACNAGDGPSPIFTVSCRHENCRNKTAFDMAAEMVASAWFDEEVFVDEAYDAVDRGAQAATPKPADAGEIKARIAELDPDDDDAVEAMLDQIATVHGAQRVEGLLVKLNKQLGGRQVTGLRKALAERQQVLHTRAKAAQAGAQGAAETVKIASDGHMTLIVCGEADEQGQKDFVRRAIDAQNRDEPVYTTVAGEIMRLRERRGVVKFEPIGERRMWGEVTDLTSIVRLTDNGASGARQLVDKDVFGAVFQTLEPRLPMTPEVIHRPAHLRSGRLVTDPGWYPGEGGDLGVYLAHGAPLVTVPLDATQADAIKAAKWVRDEVLPDFPFRDVAADGTASADASRTNALAMILTPVVRFLYDGPAPLFLIQKPQSGAGGTLLAQIAALISEGREVRPLPFLRDSEEVQKQLVSALLGGLTQFLFDNVRRLDSPDLLIALTAEMLGGRILGRSVDVERPNKFLWTATGINPVISEEMVRRIAFINIDPQIANVRDRTYKHANLDSWVLANRGEIISKLLTMVQAWLVAGRPAYTGPTLPSFGRWAAVVGGILQFAGVTGFLATPAVASTDFQAEATAEFLSGWTRRFGSDGQTAGALFDYADSTGAGLLRGRDETQRRQNFLGDLATLKNRTVQVAGKDWVVTQTLNKAQERVWSMQTKPAAVAA